MWNIGRELREFLSGVKGLEYNFGARPIGNSAASGSPPERHFFERNRAACKLPIRNDAMMQRYGS